MAINCKKVNNLNLELADKMRGMKIWIPKSIDKIEYIYEELLEEDTLISTAMADLKKYSIETYNHSMRVAMYSIYLANALSIDRDVFNNLIKGALIHDVGKMKIPSEILHYTGKYDEKQKRQIRMHPLLGIEYMTEQGVSITPEIHDVIIQHHEYCDGTGYPFGLHKKDISELSRIVTICDIFEAYIAKRVYHPQRSYREGIDYLLYLSLKGKIDSDYTRLFIQILLGI